jgi:hypothetical protein
MYMSGEARQSIIDEEHLKLLSVGYVVSAGVCAFFSLFGLLYVFMGIMMSATLSHLPETAGKPVQHPPPAFIGWFFAGFGLAIFLIAIGMAAAKFRAAWCIKHRKWRVFCMVIAGLGCLEFPYGTALGVFSFIVLGRDSVVHLFSPGSPAGPLIQS